MFGTDIAHKQSRSRKGWVSCGVVEWLQSTSGCNSSENPFVVLDSQVKDNFLNEGMLESTLAKFEVQVH